MHDPVMFPDPDDFRPERFLETTDPRLQTFELPFGFGRRVCPGMHLSLNSLFINISRILWAFDIQPSVDEMGRKVIPDSWAYTNGFNSRPESFDCIIQPRSEKASECIKAEWEMTKSRLGDWQ